MNSNNILILTSEFPPQPGGIGNHAHNLADGLQKNGYNVKVICDTRSANGKEEAQFDNNLKFEVFRIPRKKIIFFTYLKRISNAFSLAKNSEIIICSGKFSLWVGALLNVFFKRRYIAIVHGSEVLLPHKIPQKLTDVSLKFFDEAIAVSRYTKSLISYLSLKKIHVTPNGFQMDGAFSEQTNKEIIPALITVGNVTQRKGQHNVIQALPLLLKNYPKLQYHVVGMPTEKDRLLKLALDLKVEKSIVFHGKVSENEKIRLLQQANVFVMLSEATKTGDVEGFGIAIVEGNALGLPAIGAKGCGIEDAIKDSYSGKLIDGTDPTALLNALKEILGNYEEYSENAKKWASQFKWEIIILKYLDVIESDR